MGEKPRTCGQCRHLEPGMWGVLTCYARDEGTLYNLSESRPAGTCPRFAPKLEVPHGT